MASSKPRLLDLFCGAGGAARGYQQAGFYVVGVDIEPQPHYAGDEFIQADALTYPLEGYDVIHASPPCQAYSPLRALSPEKSYPDCIALIRARLFANRTPWVIENVMTAPLLGGIVLCGTMFGLRVYRHRRFESSEFMWAEGHPHHEQPAPTKGRKAAWLAGAFASVTGDIGSYVGPEGMGIDWMTGNELKEAIPPAYAKHIGRQLLAAITRGSVTLR